MRNLFLIFFLAFTLSAQEAEETKVVMVETPLRNPVLIDLIEDDISRVIADEDEGVENRIFRNVVRPTIGEVTKMGRKAVQLKVFSEYRSRDYRVASNRPVFPVREYTVSCETELRKSTEGAWIIFENECDKSLISED